MTPTSGGSCGIDADECVSSHLALIQSGRGALQRWLEQQTADTVREQFPSSFTAFPCVSSAFHCLCFHCLSVPFLVCSQCLSVPETVRRSKQVLVDGEGQHRRSQQVAAG